MNYAFYLEEDEYWSEERNRRFRNGIIPGLYRENDPTLLRIIGQMCDHAELITLLNKYRTEHLESKLVRYAKERGIESHMPPVEEPLAEWIYNNNYMMAFPLCGETTSMDNTVFRNEPEKILSYVFIKLKYHYYAEDRRKHLVCEQPNTDELYNDYFSKASEYRTYGLIPISEQITLSAHDDPVRLFDHVHNKTVFLQIPRPLAMVFNDLIKKQYINRLSFRSEDAYIYTGEIHLSHLEEAVEKGRIFTLDLCKLPESTKLYSNSYEDSLWIKHEGTDITFEELCEDFRTDENAIITQMVHLQYSMDSGTITHLDHEYIFYSIDEYEKRIGSHNIKGELKKRIKMFKIDASHIPFDYPCEMIKIDDCKREWIEVPFIYYVLNMFFVHKDLLQEYFESILL